ncbi:Panacea domain-containing protein [Aliiroseovarius sp. YM-037]|uniref:Panacea domain-containing protein n=1 Tax=Aliiroseovarius sp. YM-037 TaxID=3341728 RepID=UPI003A7F650A
MKSSKTVANEFVRLARDAGESLTPMQVLKLVYIAHGWMLALYNRPLIRDEVQAWQYGPVIPILYNQVRNFRSGPVTGISPAHGEALDSNEADLVRQVYDQYGHLSGPALSRMTHAKDTPWELTYEPNSFGLTIPNDLIEDHYSRLAG